MSVKLTFGPTADKGMQIKAEVFARAKNIIDDMISKATTYEDLDVDKLADRFLDFAKTSDKETLEFFMMNVLSSFFAGHVTNAVMDNMALDKYMNQSGEDDGGMVQ